MSYGGVQDVFVVLEGKSVGGGDEGEVVGSRSGEVKVRLASRAYRAEALDDEFVAYSEDPLRAVQAGGKIDNVTYGPPSGAALALDDSIGRPSPRGFVRAHDPPDSLAKVVGGGCNEERSGPREQEVVVGR